MEKRKSRARVATAGASGGGGTASRREREMVVVCTGRQVRCKHAKRRARARAGKHLCPCQCSEEERSNGLGFREGGQARHHRCPPTAPARCSRSRWVHSPGTPPLPSLSSGYIIGNLRFLVGLPFKSAILNPFLFLYLFIYLFLVFWNRFWRWGFFYKKFPYLVFGCELPKNCHRSDGRVRHLTVSPS